MTEAEASIGARLKAERERRGLSAQKAADALHLDEWAIEALETGDDARFGASVYAKGHLKRYAALLELAAAEPSAGHAAVTATPVAAPALTPPPSDVRSFSENPRSGAIPRPAMLGGLTAVAIIGAMVWLNSGHRHAPAAGPAAAPTDTALPAAPIDSSPAADSAPAAQLPPPTVARAATPVPTPATAATPAATSTAAPAAQAGATGAGAGHARLRLSFSADSWVDVHDATGRRAFAGNGRANSVKIISGTAPMRVYLGFASGVQLEVNSRAVAIGPQFLAGDVARFEAGADGVLRRDSHPAVDSAQARNARPTG